MAKMVPDPAAALCFESTTQWEDWLEKHHPQPEGVWLKFAKKGSGAVTLTYAQAVEAALCYGWIDGQLKSVDARFFLQRFSPRRSKSPWSKRNTEKVEGLIAAGRMRPAGLAQVEAAKADGRWQRAYDSPRTSGVPEDFQKALDASPRAKAFFASLNRGNVYAMLYRLQMVRRPETRKAKIATFVAMLKRGESLHLFKKPEKPAKSPRSREVKSKHG